jgi:formate dehydrogenase
MFALMKRGSYLINAARGALCDRDAVVRALKSGKLAGYDGDVWYRNPRPRIIPGAPCPTTG